MVKAWRIMLLTLLGREAADMEAGVIFTNAELFVMRIYARNCGLAEHKDLASAILMVALMGGYMNRKSDPPPGHTITWRCYASLQTRAIVYAELAFCDLAERPLPKRKPQLPPSPSLRSRSAAHGACPQCAPTTREYSGSLALLAPQHETCYPRQQQAHPTGSYACIAANAPMQDALHATWMSWSGP